MDIKANNEDSLKKICGGVVLAGAAFNALALFTFVTYAFKGESPYSFYFLIRSLASTIGYIVIGVAVLSEKPHLFKSGLFSVAGSFILSAYMPLTWIKQEAEYYDSLFRGNGANITCLFICIAGATGFIITGILFSQKPEWLFSNISTIAVVLLAAYVALEVIYMLYFTNSNGVTLWEYFTYYITGSGAMAVIGAIGVIILPFAFPNEIPKIEILDKTPAIQKNPFAEAQDSLPVKSAAKLSTDETVELIRKYKQLMDMGIISADEFQSKKDELL